MNLTLSTTTLPNNLKAVPIVDMRGQYPVNPKYSWEKLKGPRKITDLTTVVFHHDALRKASTAQYTDEVLLSRIATSHINSKKNLPNGDNFPYHIWIRNGRVYYANSLTDLTYGVSSNNTYTVHVCVSGDYANYDTLTDQDRDALYAAYFLVKSMLPACRAIKGHKELTPTACPGYDMTRVRNDIETIELAAAVTNTPNDQMARVYSLKTRIDDLYAKASKPNEWQEVAIKKLNKLYDMAKEEGLI